MEKRGEITTTQLVTIIVLITSFVIILFLMFRLDLGNVTDQEICHNSVVLKGRPVPLSQLDCKTSYVTIEGESKEEVMASLANEMEDCWWMFGEGKINYGTAEVLPPYKVEYAICSQIEFNKNVQSQIPSITYQEFYSYLEKKERKNSGESYLQYFYHIDEVSDFKTDERVEISLTEDVIFTNRQYSVITGVDNSKVGVVSSQEDAYIKTYIIPTSEINSRLVENKEFLTKA